MSSIPIDKDELIDAISIAFGKLLDDYKTVPSHLVRHPGVDGNIKGTHISVCDTLAYLIGWGKLVLKWHHKKSHHEPVDFPEKGYTWSELGLLATHFHDEYRDWSFESLLAEFQVTINEILALIGRLDDRELYENPWYEKWTLGRMIQFNTSSPMKNVRTKIRRFLRQQTG